MWRMQCVIGLLFCLAMSFCGSANAQTYWPAQYGHSAWDIYGLTTADAIGVVEAAYPELEPLYEAANQARLEAIGWRLSTYNKYLAVQSAMAALDAVIAELGGISEYEELSSRYSACFTGFEEALPWFDFEYRDEVWVEWETSERISENFFFGNNHSTEYWQRSHYNIASLLTEANNLYHAEFTFWITPTAKLHRFDKICELWQDAKQVFVSFTAIWYGRLNDLTNLLDDIEELTSEIEELLP